MITQIDIYEPFGQDDADPDNVPAQTDISTQMTLAAIVPAFLLLFHFFTVFPGALLGMSIISLTITASWLSHRLYKGLRPGVPAESVSIMNFSPLGQLTCICDNCVPKETAYMERRQSCRSCGHTIVARDPARLDAVMTAKEIKALTAKLAQAGIDARGLQLPTNIENIDELVEYLHDAPPPPPNDPGHRVPNRQFA